MGIVDFARKVLITQDERGNETSDWLRLTTRKKVRQLVAEGKGPVLDVGGGNGLLLDPNVSEMAGATTILDLVMEPLIEARDSYDGNGSFVCSDLTKMPFNDAAFNTTVCISTFYNLSSSAVVEAGLKEMARITKPGGRVIVDFRNADNPLVNVAMKYARLYDKSLGDLPLKPYTLSRCKKIIGDAGLRISQIQTMNFPVRPLAISRIFVAVKADDK